MGGRTDLIGALRNVVPSVYYRWSGFKYSHVKCSNIYLTFTQFYYENTLTGVTCGPKYTVFLLTYYNWRRTKIPGIILATYFWFIITYQDLLKDLSSAYGKHIIAVYYCCYRFNVLDCIYLFFYVTFECKGT